MIKWKLKVMDDIAAASLTVVGSGPAGIFAAATAAAEGVDVMAVCPRIAAALRISYCFGFLSLSDERFYCPSPVVPDTCGFQNSDELVVSFGGIESAQTSCCPVKVFVLTFWAIQYTAGDINQLIGPFGCKIW